MQTHRKDQSRLTTETGEPVPALELIPLLDPYLKAIQHERIQNDERVKKSNPGLLRLISFSSALPFVASRSHLCVIRTDLENGKNIVIFPFSF